MSGTKPEALMVPATSMPQFLTAPVPLQAGPQMLSFPDIAAAVQDVIAKYKAASASGTTGIKGWYDLFTGGINEIAAVVTELSTLDRDQTKQLIVDGVEQFYTTVIAPLEAPAGIPKILETTIIDPVVNKLIPPIVGSMVDSVLSLYDRWFTPTTATPPTSPTTTTTQAPAPATPAPVTPATPPADPTAPPATPMPGGGTAY